MTKALRTLIKLHKQFLDEKRRELVVLEEGRQQIVKFIKSLEVEFEMEKQFTAKAPERSYTFAEYANKVRGKKTEANTKINLFDKEIKKLTDQIHDAYGELKKFEIMKGIKEKKIAAEEGKKRQNELDEIAGVGHQRKMETT